MARKKKTSEEKLADLRARAEKARAARIETEKKLAEVEKKRDEARRKYEETLVEFNKWQDTANKAKSADKILGKLDRATDAAKSDEAVKRAEQRAQDELRDLFDIKEVEKREAPKGDSKIEKAAKQPANLISQFGEYTDTKGRFYSPLIERGSDNIPRVVNMPNIDDLQGFDTKDPNQVAAMSRMLGRFGFPPPDEMVERQAAYLAGFNIYPDNENYQLEMDRLATSQSGKVLLQTARRTMEQYQTLSSIDGDTEHLMMRIEEGGDEPPCDRCESVDGTTMKYSEFVAADLLPGGSSCEGGDYCHGILMPVVSRSGK